jgi:hypothetical protein
MRRAVAVGALIAGVVAAGPLPAWGKVYRWVDRQGNVIYADRPPQPDEVAPPAEPGPGTSTSHPGAPGGPRRPVHPAVDELLDLSGLKYQVQIMALQTREQLDSNLGGLEGRDRESVDRITGRAFRPETFYAVIREEFSQHVDEKRLRDVLIWYRSPVGQRITRLEVAFSASDRERELQEFVAGLATNQPSSARVALMQRLDGAGGVTESSVDLFVAVTQALARVADPHLPPARRLKPGQLESQARQIRLQLQEAFRQVNMVTLLYIYRSLDDGEVRRYIEFLESEAGGWFAAASRRTVIQTVATTVARTAGDIMRVVPPERWAVGGAFKKPPLPGGEPRL